MVAFHDNLLKKRHMRPFFEIFSIEDTLNLLMMMTKSSVKHSENQLGEKKYNYISFFRQSHCFSFCNVSGEGH